MITLACTPRARAAVGALIALLGSGAAQAQFAIDRTEMFLRSDVAESRGGILLVRNEGTERAQAVIRIEDWDRAADGSNRFFPAGTQAGSCANALKVFPLTVSLAPGESQAVRVDLDSTLTAQQRSECWSIVLVEAQQPVRQTSGRTLLYTLRTGVKVYASPGGLRLDGEVSDVVVRARSTRAGAEQATVTFRNSGERHLLGQGRIEIRRDDNSVLATVPLPAIYALPGAVMQVSAVLPLAPKGKYTLLAIVDFGGPELAAAQLDHEVP